MKLNTRDVAELSHFNTYSATWWEEEGPFRILHAITPLRMAFIKEKLSGYFQHSETMAFKNLRILDVGCGGGLLCEPLSRLGATVTGIDPLEDNIVVAREHAAAMGLSITYMPCAIEDLSEDTPPYDVIIASEIIEHVADPQGFLEACVKHLAPRGGMVVTTLNKTLKSYLLGILAAEYVLKWAPPGTHSWDKFMKPEDLSRKLSGLGLGDQEMTGLQFFPVTRSWGFSPSLDINYFLWAGRS